MTQFKAETHDSLLKPNRLVNKLVINTSDTITTVWLTSTMSQPLMGKS